MAKRILRWAIPFLAIALIPSSCAQPKRAVWNCAAEDEVVTIDNTCTHIDNL